MTEVAKALYRFYSQFGIPAYTTDNIPADAELPYITYRYVDSDFLQPLTHYAIVYMQTRNNADLLGMAEQIKDAIGTGISLPLDNGKGFVILHFNNAQLLSSTETGGMTQYSDSDVRSVYIDMQIDTLHN